MGIQRAKLFVIHGLTFTLKHILAGRHGVALWLNYTAPQVQSTAWAPGANSASNLSYRGSCFSGSQYGSRFNWP